MRLDSADRVRVLDWLRARGWKIINAGNPWCEPMVERETIFDPTMAVLMQVAADRQVEDIKNPSPPWSLR